MKQALFSPKRFTFNITPTQIIVSSFVILILIGTLLLLLPAASNDGKSAGLITALFTATTSACVTGLIVVDTGTYWSIFGQVVILFLIQIGGLGIITLATFFSVLFGRKIGLKGRILAQESLNSFNFTDILKLTKKVMFITFLIEIIGAIVLAFRFVPRYGLKGIYMGVFHSISAFCNAGIDIIGGFKSVTEYNNDTTVIFTLSILVILGGLGFIVLNDIYEYRSTKKLLLHTKIVLFATICLIVLGTILFFAFEHNNAATMGHFTLKEKINASFFQSVIPRTAGFNSIPLDSMNEISKVITILLMFIGAAPGSTAGGVKVTTFMVLFMAIVSQIRGRSSTLIFKKRVPFFSILKALTIVGLSGILVITVTTLLLTVEKAPFINILYEVTSAFGTVGQSAIGTGSLSVFSKLMIIFTMFLGRVGPVSFAIALTLRNANTSKTVVYPEGRIVVG